MRRLRSKSASSLAFVIGWALFAFLSGCAPSSQAATATTSGSTPQVTMTSPTDSEEAIPNFLMPAQEAIAEQLNAKAEQVRLLRFSAQEWPDSCLGAARPGEMCLQVITPGYQAIFETPQGEVTAHTNASGDGFRIIDIPSPQDGESGIQGQVLLSPACPGPEKEGDPCPDQPYQTQLQILDQGGRVVTDLWTDEQGFFTITLPPGDYILHPVSTDPGPPYTTDQEVEVLPNQITFVKFVFDSGIR